VRQLPFYLAGKPGRSDKSSTSSSRCDGSTVGRTWFASPTQFDQPAGKAVGAAASMRHLAAFERFTIEEMTEPRLLAINRQVS
jgi:hypothetical protein